MILNTFSKDNLDKTEDKSGNRIIKSRDQCKASKGHFDAFLLKAATDMSCSNITTTPRMDHGVRISII